MIVYISHSKWDVLLLWYVFWFLSVYSVGDLVEWKEIHESALRVHRDKVRRGV